MEQLALRESLKMSSTDLNGTHSSQPQLTVGTTFRKRLSTTVVAKWAREYHAPLVLVPSWKTTTKSSGPLRFKGRCFQTV